MVIFTLLSSTLTATTHPTYSRNTEEVQQDVTLSPYMPNPNSNLPNDVKKNINLTIEKLPGKPPLITAIAAYHRFGHNDHLFQYIEDLIETNKHCVTTPDNEDQTPLLWATHINDIKVLELLIKNGAIEDINRHNFWGQSPLYMSIVENSINMQENKVAKFLIENGANPTLTNKSGFTAVGMALVYPYEYYPGDHEYGPPEKMINFLKHNAHLHEYFSNLDQIIEELSKVFHKFETLKDTSLEHAAPGSRVSMTAKNASNAIKQVRALRQLMQQ